VKITQPFGLSLGDRACLALAIQRQATALTTDRAWRTSISESKSKSSGSRPAFQKGAVPSRPHLHRTIHCLARRPAISKKLSTHKWFRIGRQSHRNSGIWVVMAGSLHAVQPSSPPCSPIRGRHQSLLVLCLLYGMLRGFEVKANESSRILTRPGLRRLRSGPSKGKIITFSQTDKEHCQVVMNEANQCSKPPTTVRAWPWHCQKRTAMDSQCSSASPRKAKAKWKSYRRRLRPSTLTRPYTL